jgi:hypothetical protein
MENLAKTIDLNDDELKHWVKLQMQEPMFTPAKSILNLLRTANQHQLDPLQNQVVIIQFEQSWQVSISVDGWMKIINQYPTFAGITFAESSEQIQGVPLWIECTIHRSDRAIPTTIREYYCEVKNDSEIWDKMPRRMLRHRSLQQCARVAMGITPPHSQEELQIEKMKRGNQAKMSFEEKLSREVAGMQLLKMKLNPPANEQSN